MAIRRLRVVTEESAWLGSVQEEIQSLLTLARAFRRVISLAVIVAPRASRRACQNISITYASNQMDGVS